MSSKSKLLSLSSCAAALLLAACQPDAGAPSAPEQDTAPRIPQVVLVSVDGLRGDALRPDRMPRMAALRDAAVWSDRALTIVPSLTAPAHLALFTGRDVTALGITSNQLDAGTGALLLLNGATSLFSWTRDAGGGTRAVVSDAFVPVAALSSGAALLGIDSLAVVPAAPDSIAAHALAALDEPAAPALVFAHIATVDEAGHAAGWIVPDTSDDAGDDVLTPAYLDAVRATDAALGRLYDALAPRIAAGEVALVLTADHGGGHGEGCTLGVAAEREHCTASPGDVRIPLLIVARGLAPRELPAGVRITQIAPTIAGFMAVRPSPSSHAEGRVF